LLQKTMAFLPLNDSDIYFLKEIGAHEIDHFSWRIDSFDEAAYYFEYHRPPTYDHVGQWSVLGNPHHVSPTISDGCKGGELKEAFERVKKITEWAANNP
jgi:hypothetical protein